MDEWGKRKAGDFRLSQAKRGGVGIGREWYGRAWKRRGRGGDKAFPTLFSFHTPPSFSLTHTGCRRAARASDVMAVAAPSSTFTGFLVTLPE